ncbi:NEW3 domain-containing protein [Halorubrum ezzemoulense]|uniref:InlB B-repeat-containing protein n=1 Tax=Halorubrum ezzemoulense TaxID=337243 RepID=UPI00232C13D5|nr:NEW3 domain-containing protein [Halorubrum ezzemoulense]MDB9281437.1 NEW3 domain-containing protein [Halorubrum ezzemoulense]MDB9284982.1 NEW3 domain-containing protein [Halorubrum ezzemoulense]
MEGRQQAISAILLAVVITTGAFVPFVQPATAQNEPPAPTLDGVDIPDEVTVGESFEVVVDASNDGGRAGAYSTITVSSPDLDESGDGSQVTVTDDFDHSYSAVSDAGDEIFDKNGDSLSAEYALAEAGTVQDTFWDSGESRSFAAEITPEETGTLEINVRTTLIDDEDSSEKYTAPSSGPEDQQGYTVRQYEVEVKEETEISAEIEDVDPPSGDYTPGEDATAETTVRNTGNVEHEFYVGYSVRGPDGEWRDNDRSTHESVWVEPGEEETVDVEWEVEDDAPTGEYDIWTSVYRDADGDQLEDRLDESRMMDVFEVETETEEYRLNVDTDGEGGFEIDPPGFSTTSVDRNYEEGTVVELTANPGPDNRFVEWSGDLGSADEDDRTIEVTMNEARDITAEFEEETEEYRLNADTDGEGGFEVDPPGFSTTSVDREYEEGTTVELTATPEPDSRFVEWTGDIGSADGDESTIEVTMDEARDITARFEEVSREYRLEADTDGDGGLEVYPPGFSTTSVDREYEEGTRVELTATPEPDSRFVEWTGDIGFADETDRTIEVTMDEARDITAEFKEETKISAEIEDFDPPSGDYTAGEEIVAETTIRNTGNTEHEFYVGYSVRGPDGEWRDNDRSTHKQVWVEPGARETVNVEWQVEEDAPTGEYDVWTTVYRDERYGDLEDRLDGERRGDVFEVAAENSPPTLRADEPSDQTTISPGEEVYFEVDVEDSDGNLQGVDWYVEGTHEESSYVYGSSASPRWDTIFDSSGTYRVEARAHDEEGQHSEPVSWTVEVEEPERIQAAIGDVDWPNDEATYSDRVETSVEVENTGNTRHEFYVGYSVRGPDGEWRDNDGSTHESVTLSPGEQRQVNVEWEITDEAPAGDYDVWTTVYADRSGEELQEKRDERRQSSIFSVEETNQTGTVTGYVTTSDGDGLEDVSVTVGGITVKTNPDGYYDAENVPIGKRTVSATIEGQEYTKQQSVSAGQQVTTDIEVDLQTTDIQITSFDPQTGTFSPGDEITASVGLVNEGNEEKTVRATLGHRGPTGTLLDGGDESTTSLTLAPSQQTTTELSWTVGDDPNVGTYDAVLTVSAGDSQIAQSAENDSVNLQSTDDAATLLDYSQESGTYEPDDTIEVEFAVENNEESSTTYYVEYVARGSNGETYANDAYFVTRPPSGAESPPTTIRYAVPESAPNGTYDGVLRVWKGRSPDTSQPPADQVTISDVFSVENPNASEPEPPDEEAPTGNVTIRVEGSSGEAVEGTKVGVNLLGDNKEKTVGNDGVATFEVPRRDVKYTAYYVGRSDIIQERKPVLVDSEGPHDVAFEIKETGTLRGTVTIDGEPVTGDITLQGSETQIEDGVFEFDDKVPIGYKTLVIDPDGNGPTRYASVRIEPGENGETIQITERFRIGEYVSGAVLGDIGYRNRETISVEYTLGWMTSTTIPISDVRDLASSASAGDKVDTAVNVVAIVPLVGDSSTVISRIGKFVKKAPPKAVRDFAKIIRRSSKFNGMRYRALSELGYGDTLESLTRAGFSRAEATKLVSVAKSSDVSSDALRSAVSKADVAPKAVRKAVKNEETGDVVLLTKGVRNEDGWTHIVRGHIGGTDRVIDSYKTFFPTGKEVKFKKHADEVLPARMTEKQVEEMVLTAIKKGDEPTDIGGGVAYTIDPRKHGYDVGITKIQVEVSDGIVKTAYPTKGPSVYEYRPNGELIKGVS